MEFRGIQLIVFIAIYISRGESTVRLRIVNGQSVKRGHFPHQVSIQKKNQHVCGGSILDTTHILTAAHCLYFPEDPENYEMGLIRVVTGVIDKEDSNPTNTFQISRMNYHRNFSREPPGNDIAILTLMRPIPFNDYQRPIRLPTHNTKSIVEATMTGFGRGNFEGSTRKKMRYLQKLNMITVDLRECQKIYGTSITAGQICAKGAPGSGMCIGDSGGPLIRNGEIIGIASWVEARDGLTCATGSPDIFTRVYYYIPWIKIILSGGH